MAIAIDLSQLVTAEAKAAQALSDAKVSAITTINAKVTEARAELLTDLIGQEMIYLAKEQEAKNWQAATDPALTDYPLLSAEVGVTADTAEELATLWLTMADQWRQSAATLEAIRLQAKGNITAAETAEAVQTVLDGIDW